MATNKLGLTRDQLASFLNDHEQVRQFEKLFAAANQVVPVDQGGTGATTAAGARYNLGAAASGANSDITSLSGIDSIQFDTAAAVTVGQGQMAWNAADGCLDIGMGYDAVTQQVGLEQYYRIKASGAITNGQCIMFAGSVGASGVLKGSPATAVTNGQYIMGVATMDIANNGFGYVTSFGLVRGINTSGSSVGEVWSDGDILYYNPAYAGGLTKTAPAAPLPKVVVAAVVNAASGGSGSLFIRVQPEPDLHNLSDVYAPSAISNGQILIGNTALARWEAATLTPGTNITISNGAGSITINATTPSDARLKHDIVDAPEASDIIDSLRVRSFKWNNDNKLQSYGFVAQELAEIAPESVLQPGGKDAMMSVDYISLIPMLVKEIQSLRKRISHLEGN